MRNWFVGFTISAITLLIPLSAVGQSAAPIPRMPDGKPNFNGVWQALNTAAWDIQNHSAELNVPAGQSVVEGNEIPYQAWALEKKQANSKNRRQLDLVERKGFMPGTPRIMYMPFPYQIVQTPHQISMLFEYAHTQRNIMMNSEHPEGEPGDLPFWMGDSRGKWDGDTLVVSVKFFTDQTWFDKVGNFHSEAMQLIERYTPMGPDHIQYEVTIEDPKVFTRPWKMSMPLYRRKEPNVRVLEYEAGYLIEQAIEDQYVEQMINGIDR